MKTFLKNCLKAIANWIVVHCGPAEPESGQDWIDRGW